MKLTAFFEKFDRPDVGLFILRVIVGIYMTAHGIFLLQGGSETYNWLGQQLAVFGVTFAPTLWGFLAAFIETVGGIVIIVGFLFRPVQLLLFIVMVVAIVYHVNNGDDIYKVIAFPGILAAVFFAFLFLGPGKYSTDKK